MNHPQGRSVTRHVRPKKRKSDDAFKVIRRLSSKFDVMMKEMYVIGALPWDEDRKPKFLYKITDDIDASSVIASFCFPRGTTDCKIRTMNKQMLMSEFMSDSNIRDAQLVPLYFAEDTSAPFLFCLRVEVNELTIPTLCHDKTLEEIMTSISLPNGDIQLHDTTIVIGIRAKLPFSDLFCDLLKWMLECELIARMRVVVDIDHFLQHGVLPPREDREPEPLEPKPFVWPASQRQELHLLMSTLMSDNTPEVGETFSVDQAPYPVFKWTRPPAEHPYLILGMLLMKNIIPKMSAKFFLRLFSDVLLEKTIIFYSPDMKLECEVVMAMHMFLRPFLWVSGSVSCLSDTLLDVLDSPNPVMVGTSFPITRPLEENMVYVDFEKQTITPKGDVPEMPELAKLMTDLTSNWSEDTSDEAFTVIHKYMGMIGHALEMSIMTDMTDKEEIVSRFVKELFFGRFPKPSHPFLREMIQSQMFRFTMEQKCRMKSDAELEVM